MNKYNTCLIRIHSSVSNYHTSDIFIFVSGSKAVLFCYSIPAAPDYRLLTECTRELSKKTNKDKTRVRHGVWCEGILSQIYTYINIYICHTYEYITHIIPCQGNHETGLSYCAYITLLHTQDVRRKYIS